MRASIVEGGGLGGLVRTVSVDTESDELRSRVESADFFALPSLLGDAAAPDEPTYAITVDAHTVTVSERALPAELRALIDWIRSAPGRAERIEPA
jgi:emfourin